VSAQQSSSPHQHSAVLFHTHVAAASALLPCSTAVGVDGCGVPKQQAQVLEQLVSIK
jgi:hypothetical protein